MKTDTMTTGAPTVAGGTIEDASPTTAHAATHAVGIAAAKHDKRNASITSGVVKKTATTEELGRIGSVCSSNTARAEGWSGSQPPRIARSAPPDGPRIGGHRCSKGANARRRPGRAACRLSGLHRKNPAGSVRSSTSYGGAQTGSPDHRSGESRGYAASNKPKNTTFGSSNR